MKNIFKVFMICLLVTIMAISSTGTALAAEGEKEKVLPNVGPEYEGFVPGINGYKVFGSNAVDIQPIVRNTKDFETLDEDLYRHSSTDIWDISHSIVRGSHTSESDMYEDEIHVDGAIKKEDQGWYDSQEDHTAGQFANCITEMPNPAFWQTYIAHSWHHYHTDGYVDANRETEDTLENV